LTIKAIEADGFEVDERVEMLVASDSPEAVAKSMGLGAIGFAQTYERLRPDILLVLGDRFEMHAAALSALPFKIPVAHIHGGELTEGAIDDALRHSMTKLSHLHFVTTEEYARRVRQMGEEAWRVTISGAPSLDNLQAMTLFTMAELEKKYAWGFTQPPLLVTFHPVTLEYEQTEQQMEELLAALKASRMPVLFTLPNADTGGRVIMRLVREYVDREASAHLVDNLGTQAYFSLMARAAAMVGNSSSGIIEAASFKLPVVNIGNRQKGRARGRNVIDVGGKREEILAGIEKALAADFRASLFDLANPYGDGTAAAKIVRQLKEVTIDQRLLVKRFQDLEPSSLS
ncbi:MAG TPA: UDP-N-acetylglucosamine 2-epimerase, partial [Pyrinomonadaceae bacterium]